VFEGHVAHRLEDARVILAEPAVAIVCCRSCAITLKVQPSADQQIQPAFLGNQQETSFSRFLSVFFVLAFPVVFAAQIDNGGDADL